MDTRLDVELRARDFLARLCSIHSPAGREALIVPPIAAELERLGAEIRVQEIASGRANLLATWGEPRVILSTHLDVVPPELPCIVDATGISARGACDAKGQIAAQVAALELLLAEGLPPGAGLAWLGVAGEESDSAGAAASLELAPRLAGCRAIVVGEPTGCALARGQKGFLRLRLSCEGRSAHGATPELGENAVFALMDWLAAIRRSEPALHPELGREAWNLGIVEGGGAANVVPDRASAELVLRCVPGGSLRAAVESSRPPRGRIEVLLDEPWARFDTPEGFPAAPVPFGSDLPAMRALAQGGAAILAGPGSAALAHTERERLTWAELSAGIGLFRDLSIRYMRPPRSEA